MNSHASIYIPRMSTIHTEDSITRLMSLHNIGTVMRVDFTTINKKPGFSENTDSTVISAFVHFSDPIIKSDGCYDSATITHVSNLDFWNCMAYNQSYRLQITHNEYWICLKNKNPIQRTMMNIHQVVENGRHLEKLVEEHRIMLESQEKKIAELTKTNQGFEHIIYQFVGGLFNQETQGGIIASHLSTLGFGDYGEEDTSRWDIWPTTRQGDDCEARIEKIERIIRNSSLRMRNASAVSPILDEDGEEECIPCVDVYEYEDYLFSRGNNIDNKNYDGYGYEISNSPLSMSDTEGDSTRFVTRIRNSRELCGNN
jgi:hypothetical protein